MRNEKTMIIRMNLLTQRIAELEAQLEKAKANEKALLEKVEELQKQSEKKKTSSSSRRKTKAKTQEEGKWAGLLLKANITLSWIGLIN